jgi:hypothetical protein
MLKKKIYHLSFLTSYGLNEEDATLIINTKHYWEDKATSGLFKDCINFSTKEYPLKKLQDTAQRINKFQLVMHREGFDMWRHLTSLYMEVMDLYIDRCFNLKYIVRE